MHSLPHLLCHFLELHLQLLLVPPGRIERGLSLDALYDGCHDPLALLPVRLGVDPNLHKRGQVGLCVLPEFVTRGAFASLLLLALGLWAPSHDHTTNGAWSRAVRVSIVWRLGTACADDEGASPAGDLAAPLVHHMREGPWVLNCEMGGSGPLRFTSVPPLGPTSGPLRMPTVTR